MSITAAAFRRSRADADAIAGILRIDPDSWSDVTVTFGHLDDHGPATAVVTFLLDADQLVALARHAAGQTAPKLHTIVEYIGTGPGDVVHLVPRDNLAVAYCGAGPDKGYDYTFVHEPEEGATCLTCLADPRRQVP
jgi:hypothetical protein